MRKTLFFLLFILLSIDLSCQNKAEDIFTQGEIFKNEQITGKVLKHIFYSQILENRREVYVWLPNDYSLSKKKIPCSHCT